MAEISKAVRLFAVERALACCEYCLLPQFAMEISFQVDHIVPLNHDGNADVDNLCLSCPTCNRYKGGDIGGFDPQTGVLTALFHPRKDVWRAHFTLAAEFIVPLSAVGRVTVRRLRLNHPEQLTTRRLWLGVGVYPGELYPR